MKKSKLLSDKILVLNKIKVSKLQSLYLIKGGADYDDGGTHSGIFTCTSGYQQHN